MAKKDKANASETQSNNETTEARTDTHQSGSNGAPGGYEDQSDDVVGYWAQDKGAIHCIPRGARLFDGNIDKSKPSVLLYVQLVEPCEVTKKTDGEEAEEESFTAPAGAMVGVWGKPGMRAIRNLAGVKVWMKQEGTKDTGKGNPMKLYKVKSEPGGALRGKPIPITEDTRIKSRPSPTFLSHGAADGEEDSPEAQHDA